MGGEDRQEWEEQLTLPPFRNPSQGEALVIKEKPDELTDGGEINQPSPCLCGGGLDPDPDTRNVDQQPDQLEREHRHQRPTDHQPSPHFTSEQSPFGVPVRTRNKS